MEQIACLYWTVDSLEAAQILIDGLIEQKLIACANLLPGVSLYPWAGRVEKGNEHFVFCKTTQNKVAAAVTYLEEHHSYDIPCITSWQISSSTTYARWVQSVTQ